MIAFLILYLNLQQFFISPPEFGSEEVQSKIDQFLGDANTKKKTEDEKAYEPHRTYSNEDTGRKKTGILSPEYFPFNPNTATADEWAKLGLKEWQVKAVAKYRHKAGDFKTAEDFKRLRAINDDQFSSLEAYIQLPSVNENDDSKAKEEQKDKTKLPLFELNQSTAADLRKIRGIGPVLSGRIVEYRKLLGGFIVAEQVMEVYGIEDSLFNAIASQLFVDKSIIYKININKAPAHKFSKHPYINWNIANAIVNYRDQHGSYIALEDIKNTDVVSDELLEKILPYLALD